MTHSDIAGGSVFSVSPKSFQRYYGSIDVGYGADGPVISSSCRHLSHLVRSIFCYLRGNISVVVFISKILWKYWHRIWWGWPSHLFILQTSFPSEDIHILLLWWEYFFSHFQCYYDKEQFSVSPFPRKENGWFNS